MKYLVTGTAGFIGFHVANALLARGDEVVGIDRINDYYNLNLKFARLEDSGIPMEEIRYNRLIQSSRYPNYRFVRINLEDALKVVQLFQNERFDGIIHLAAQAGVRYSIENPHTYIESNISAFINLLEACRNYPVQHLVYASSSSVYGANQKIPFSTTDNVDQPVSLYAATKKSNELMAHTYSHLFQIPTTGLRFFTVYGPWGRPDMAYFLFTEAILKGKPIKVFNHGNMARDFTYVDDIVQGVLKVLDQPPKKDLIPPYRIYNIGNNAPVPLMDFITAIEDELGVTAQKEFLPLQPGDVEQTYADVQNLIDEFGYQPTTTVKEGIKHFIAWYKKFYKV
ncbi:MAG: NAD-dependent epimerase [Saprospiraceae bacterium]|nr:NAD-dependent epimerase [Saprospiraceae bacterium]